MKCTNKQIYGERMHIRKDDSLSRWAVAQALVYVPAVSESGWCTVQYVFFYCTHNDTVARGHSPQERCKTATCKYTTRSAYTESECMHIRREEGRLAEPLAGPLLKYHSIASICSIPLPEVASGCHRAQWALSWFNCVCFIAKQSKHIWNSWLT